MRRIRHKVSFIIGPVTLEEVQRLLLHLELYFHVYSMLASLLGMTFWVRRGIGLRI